jgi:hypothetical protein
VRRRPDLARGLLPFFDVCVNSREIKTHLGMVSV